VVVKQGDEPTIYRLPEHEICLKDTYGKRSFVINQSYPLERLDEYFAQLAEDDALLAAADAVDPSVGDVFPTVTTTGNPVTSENPRKRSLDVVYEKFTREEESRKKAKKELFVNGVTMHKETTEMLFNVAQCVDAQLKELKKYVELVNTMFEIVLEYVEIDFNHYSLEKRRRTLTKNSIFGEYFKLDADKIEMYLTDKLASKKVTYEESLFKRICCEFQSFAQCAVMKTLYDKIPAAE